MSKAIRFKATIEDAGEGTGGAYVLFPYDVAETFGIKGRVPVTATIDGVPYRGSLVRYGHPQHMFPVLKGIREQIGKGIGDTIEVVIEHDTEKRRIETPDDLQKALKENKLEAVFQKLSYTHQREYIHWLDAAKKAETRAGRIAKAIEMIKAPKTRGSGTAI